jgi:uncharacterized membrane protein YhhN
LTLLAVITALLHVRAEYWGPRYHVYLFKPLTTIAILLVAVNAGLAEGAFYRIAIASGLVCSLAGDVWLMLPSDHFISGLISFLVTHLVYAAAFVSEAGPGFSTPLLTPFLIYGGLMLAVLWPHLGSLRMAVMAYLTAILVMAWQACERWLRVGDVGAMLGALGAVLFIISDSALAIRRFRGYYRSAQVLTLSTYYVAQWLIALSVY